METNDQNTGNDNKAPESRLPFQVAWAFILTFVVLGNITFLGWFITIFEYLILIAMALYHIAEEVVPEVVAEVEEEQGPAFSGNISWFGFLLLAYQCALFIFCGWTWTAAAAVLAGGYIIGRLGLPKF